MAGEAKTLYVRLAANITGYTAGMTTAGAVTDEFDKKLQDASSSAGDFGELAGGIAAGGALALATGLAAAVMQAAAFEKNMRNVNSISKLSESQLAALSTQVLDLSRKLPQSADDLSKGLYDIASSGFQGADGLKVLNASATAASAGLSTTAVAAKAITAVINAYGKTADDAADISDVLFQTVNLGVVSFDELAGTIGDFVGLAAQMHIPIEDATAALATMTLSGIPAAEAATALNRTFQALLDPSDALAAAFKSMGFESGEAALKGLGSYRAVMTKISEATGGSATQMQKFFPEVRALKGALALAAGEGQKYAEVASQIEEKSKRAAATSAALAEQAKGVAFQFGIMRNKVSANLIELGEKALPKLAEAMAFVTAEGGKAGDVISAAFRVAKPILQDVWDIAVNISQVLRNAGEDVAPLAKGLAELGGGAVLGGLRLTASALKETTGFLSEHQGAVLLLALAYGATLVPALFRGIAAFNLMVRANVAAIFITLNEATLSAAVGMQTMTVAAAGLLAAEAAVTLGIPLLVAGVLAFATAASKAEDRAKRLADQMAKGFDPSGKNVKELQTLAAEYDQQLESAYAARDAALAVGRSYHSVGGAAATVIRQMTPMKNTLADARAEYEQQSKTIEELERKAATFSENLLILKNTFGLSDQSAFEFSKTLGVDLTGSTDKVASAVNDYAAALYGSANPATSAAKKAIAGLGDATVSTTDKIKLLKDAFDALIGVHLSTDAAVGKLEEAYDGLIAKAAQTHVETTKVGKGNTELSTTVRDIAYDYDKATGRLQQNTEAQRKGSSSARDAVGAILDLATSMREEGISREKTASTVQGRIARLKEELTATGLTKAQVDKLLESYGLAPKDVKTLIEASGADAATQQMKDAKTAADALNGTTATVTVRTVNISTGRSGGSLYNSQVPKQADPNYVSPNNGSYRPGAQRAGGGAVFGPGTSTSDSIPARLSDGEFVIRTVAAKSIGYDRLAAMNARGYAAGGVVTPPPSYVDMSSVMSAVTSQTDAKGKPLAFSWARYAAELGKQLAAQEAWRRQLARITALAGDDVSKALADMGEQGTDLVARMATGTDAQVRVMTKSFGRLVTATKPPLTALEEWATGLAKAKADGAQFEKDLATLTRRGAGEVAEALRSMGPEAGAQIARQAATASQGALAGIAKSIPKTVSALTTWRKELGETARAQEQFDADLAKLAARGRGDIADALKSMGVDNAGDIARDAARASSAALAEIAKLVPKQKSVYEQYADSVLTAAAAQEQFNANLGQLDTRGFSGLSEALRGMGAEQAGLIAAQAAGADSGSLARLEATFPRRLSALEQYTKGIEDARAAQAEFNANLDRIGLHGNGDIAEALRQMGVEQAGQIAAEAAWATQAALDRISAALPKQQTALAKYQDNLNVTVSAQRQFNDDLLALINQGKSDLAAAFLDMGAETAGGLARQAVGASGAALAQLTSDVAAQAALVKQLADMPSLLKLMALLRGGAGLKELVDGSGIDIPTTLGLLNKYRSMIDTIPAGQLSAINADLAAINAGRQPKGYKLGGIAPEGQFYRYAERGTGGEVNIPLRGLTATRAATLVQAAATSYGMSTAGGSVHISIGDVIVPTHPGMDEVAVARAVRNELTPMLDTLIRRHRAGRV